MHFHVDLNSSKFNKKCICWLVNNIKVVISLYATYLTTLSIAQATIKVYRCVILSFCMGMKPGLSH